MSELKEAYSLHKKNFLDIIFSALKDDDEQIRKVGLMIIQNSLQKLKTGDFKDVFMRQIDKVKN